MRVFKKNLFDRYSKTNFNSFSYENYRDNFNQFIEEYPVILSTTYALVPTANKSFLFDYLIIDEASQTDMLSSVLSLSCAKNIIIVGDTKQLSQIENEGIIKINNILSKHYQIEDEYNYHDNNILTSFLKVFPEAPRTLLKEHYRCEPKIIDFCNQKFYNNQLKIMTHNKEENPLLLVKTVPGNHARKNPEGSGYYNQREIDEIKLILEKTKYKDIGIITPFRKQAEEIRRQIDNSNIEVDTVHKFQGRAKDLIIISTVSNSLRYEADSNIEDFIVRADLLNVAVSRAKKQLCVITSDKIFYSKKNHISDLVNYIRYNCNESDMSNGNVVSVFDLLYSDYSFELRSFKRKNRKFTFDSENIVYSVIQETLEDYPEYKLASHVRLSNLINDYSSFCESDINYLTHPWTHVDFVIYSSIHKEPILIIEVDGVSFHEQSEKQRNHDKIKDEALLKNGLILLRLKTNESNEKQRILDALNMI